MKIFDLNVNNFGGPDDEKPRVDDFPSLREYVKARNAFQKASQRIIAVEAIICEIKKEKPDVIILQECDVNAPAGRKLAESLRECSYYPVYPNREDKKAFNKTPSITMMFVNNDAVDRYPSPGPAQKAWKWCGIGIGDLMISGVHFPDEKDYLDDVKRYSETHKNEKLIILGDFNIATNDWRIIERIKESIDSIRAKDKKKQTECEDFFARLAWLLKFKSDTDYTDAIKGNPITYFKKGTTIDHVLVSPTLRDKYKVTAEVKPQRELELSDHAVIIVTIDE